MALIEKSESDLCGPILDSEAKRKNQNQHESAKKPLSIFQRAQCLFATIIIHRPPTRNIYVTTKLVINRRSF